MGPFTSYSQNQKKEIQKDLKVMKGYGMNHFDELVNLLGPYLHKQETSIRECISPRKCVASH